MEPRSPTLQVDSLPSEPLRKPLQFSSVAQSCQTLCDPMNCSTPGLPVHHQFPEFTQTQVLLTWGVPLSVSYHFAFSYRSGVLKARILKWFAIPFSSGPHSVRPLHHDPPHTAWLSFTELDKAVVRVIRLTSFLWLRLENRQVVWICELRLRKNPLDSLNSHIRITCLVLVEWILTIFCMLSSLIVDAEFKQGSQIIPYYPKSQMPFFKFSLIILAHFWGVCVHHSFVSDPLDCSWPVSSVHGIL